MYLGSGLSYVKREREEGGREGGGVGGGGMFRARLHIFSIVIHRFCGSLA